MKILWKSHLTSFDPSKLESAKIVQKTNSYFEHMIYNSPGFYYVARCQLFVIEPSDSYELARRSTSTLSMNVLTTQQKHLQHESNQCEILIGPF